MSLVTFKKITIFIILKACRNFYDDGVCTQECPAMQRYNSITYSWETNPNGKYAYGATCVKNCPEHLLKDNGACVRSCPPKKKVRIVLNLILMHLSKLILLVGCKW